MIMLFQRSTKNHHVYGGQNGATLYLPKVQMTEPAPQINVTVEVTE